MTKIRHIYGQKYITLFLISMQCVNMSGIGHILEQLVMGTYWKHKYDQNRAYSCLEIHCLVPDQYEFLKNLVAENSTTSLRIRCTPHLQHRFACIPSIEQSRYDYVFMIFFYFCSCILTGACCISWEGIANFLDFVMNSDQ